MTQDTMRIIHLVDTASKAQAYSAALSNEERVLIESDEAAMRAVLDHEAKVFDTEEWLKFYDADFNFQGAAAMMHRIPGKILFVETHLFYLSTSPKLRMRRYADLMLAYTLLRGYAPYTMVRNEPKYQYMHNFMKKSGCSFSEQKTHTFYGLTPFQEPKVLKSILVTWV